MYILIDSQPLEDDDEDDEEEVHSSYTGMTAALVEAMQERRKQITGKYDPSVSDNKYGSPLPLLSAYS